MSLLEVQAHGKSTTHSVVQCPMGLGGINREIIRDNAALAKLLLIKIGPLVKSVNNARPMVHIGTLVHAKKSAPICSHCALNAKSMQKNAILEFTRQQTKQLVCRTKHATMPNITTRIVKSKRTNHSVLNVGAHGVGSTPIRHDACCHTGTQLAALMVVAFGIPIHGAAT